ncbi:unnamed protein product [[Candida] boidinii]|uniref:Unnamed protein product n=1 Tax=Candida boidinii TaxID=5477 RepID=A0ACB5UAD3_CANBO|nr:unnamed protein product [[Candida] boidinii]
MRELVLPAELVGDKEVFDDVASNGLDNELSNEACCSQPIADDIGEILSKLFSDDGTVVEAVAAASSGSS